ncbi:hypothetical protein KC343_g2789 [Hortaea werneckii]|nr:hypothetical protein KC352_g4397 [Hortaea werneckii]KAI7572806.1 hypothetical protein KC317_g429 [Hortaea werneckii]KAI7628139.1 hypothetical protein KC346_g364 [Hortaea werneckii]KAI7633692.1 hypothetical protein KC343_g2789 [Hortaea werneckii]KAI7723767.1 hypothetical protein KC322_g636 [Hortaea werneckii]
MLDREKCHDMRIIAIGLVLIGSFIPAWSLECPATAEGGRKVGIVIDSSESNTDTDPNDLRIAAGRALNDALYSSAEAVAAGVQSDLVTVIDFDSSATVLYSLGDPDGATAAFSSIDARGQTCIYCGIREAIEELTQPDSGPTAGRTSIVVLTDGEGRSEGFLARDIQNATALGIKVSFGYLSTASDTADSQPPAVINAILGSGGVYSTINDANAQTAFIDLVLSRGLTAAEGSNNGLDSLVSGLEIATSADASGRSFRYSAQSNETLTFTITSVTAGALDVVLRDGNGNELGSTTVASSGSGSIDASIPSAGDLQLAVVAEDTSSDAIFTVTVDSDLGIASGISNCTVPSNETSSVPNLSTPSPTSKPPSSIISPSSSAVPASSSIVDVPHNNTGLPTNDTSAPSMPSNSPSIVPYTGAAAANAIFDSASMLVMLVVAFEIVM